MARIVLPATHLWCGVDGDSEEGTFDGFDELVPIKMPMGSDMLEASVSGQKSDFGRPLARLSTRMAEPYLGSRNCP